MTTTTVGSINHGLTEAFVGCPAERKGPIGKQETQTTKKTGNVTKTSRSRTNKAVEKRMNMVSDDKGTISKKLYSFIKSKKCDGSGVASLKKDGKTYADASEKAELLNEQFS